MQDRSPNDRPPYDRLPLVIGVTGDRDLDGAAWPIADAVQQHLLQLHNEYPHTPFLVLSSLAEGNDQLVARAALGLRNDSRFKSCVDLIYVRPMPELRYLETFSPAHDLERYHRLKGKAIRTVDIPEYAKPPDAEPLPQGVSPDDIQILLAGAYIARNCHVVLAVWDRQPARRLGGTANIVRFKRTGQIDWLDWLPREHISALKQVYEVFGTGFDPLEMPDAGPVDWIEFPLKPGKAPEVKRLAPERYDADHEACERYLKLIKLIYGKNLERFNATAAAIAQVPGPNWCAEFAGRLPGHMHKTLSDPLRDCLATYTTADQAAIQFQNRLGRMLTHVLVLIIAAVVAFGLYAHLVNEKRQPAWLSIYLFLLILADLLFMAATKSDAFFEYLHNEWLPWFHGHDDQKRSQKYPVPSSDSPFERVRNTFLGWFQGRDDQKRYQDYRTLCEGLRVQFYWRLAGLTDSVGDYYLTRQKNELDWIHSSVRSWALLVPTPTATDATVAPENERLEAVRRHWVLHQLNYYIKSTYANRILHVTFRQAGSGLLFASILVSFVVALLGRLALRQWSWPVALVFAFGVAVGLLHYVLRRQELVDESREDQEEMTWIMGYAASRDEIKPPPGITGVLNALWLRPLRYFFGSDGSPRPSTRRLARFAFGYGLGIGIGTTMLFAALARILAAYFEPNRMGLKHELSDWMIVAMVLNVALAAFVQWYTEKRAFGVHYRQFRRMLTILILAYEDLSKGLDPIEARKLLKRLGRESLAEHADWLLIHRDRPMELPKLEL